MNLILVVIDSLRADYVGVNGNDWIRTPHMDRFAKQGTLFSHAYPESLPTIPARRTLFTGRRCFPFSDWKFDPEWQVPGWIPIPRGQKTLAQVLQTHGYTTALVSDVFHVFRPEMNFHLGFDEFHWTTRSMTDAPLISRG